MLLAGVSTAVVQAGDGPPLVLLHGPGGSAVHWARVLPQLAETNLVIAPDLPGQGSSEVLDGALDADRVLTWLGDLIDGTCPAPPALVGYALGGAIAARFAAERGDRLARLVLVDALGLAPFEPAPDSARPSAPSWDNPIPSTHDRLWGQCVLDLPTVARAHGRALAGVRGLQPRPRPDARRAGGARTPDGAVRHDAACPRPSSTGSASRPT